jgi:hypothetical protein
MTLLSSKTMAGVLQGAGGSKNSTLTKPYSNQKNDLESLMAKFNNSLAIQNLMSTAAANQ